jgi:diguanylate cyclase (GGDEF)-like protein
MVEDAKLADEAGRIAALHRYEVLDTPAEAPFDRITKLVQVVLDVPVATVTLIDTDRQWFKSCIGLAKSGTPREEAFCDHTIRTRGPMNISDATLDSRFAGNVSVTGEPHIRSYLGVPLSTPDGYNIGALCAIDMRPREFTAEQTAVLASFASLVVDELELRRIAQTDHLTGAATRRGFVHELEKQIARMRRSGRPSALVMLDVDHFKRVNDTYGHPTGDAVLRNLAGCIGGMLRKGDVLGRLGGEEFGILLPDADVEAAFAYAERVREAVRARPLVEEPALGVTISLGVSAEPAAATPEAWMRAADGALYEAKRTGRDRTCLA